MRTIRRALDRLPLYWEAGLRRLPFFTQRTAVLLLGVLVAALAMVGGVVALVGWPGANGPAHLVPGERAGQAPESRPEPGDRPAPGSSGAGARSGADAGGATAASPSPADQPGDATTSAGGEGSRGTASGTQGSGDAASGAQGSGARPPGHKGPAVRPARAPGARQPHRRPRPRQPPLPRVPSTRSTSSSARSSPPCFPSARARSAARGPLPLPGSGSAPSLLLA